MGLVIGQIERLYKHMVASFAVNGQALIFKMDLVTIEQFMIPHVRPIYDQCKSLKVT